MKQINIHIIRTDGDTQSRVRLNQEVVNEYAEHLKDGDVFPPMVVFHDGSDYWLADGFHRLFAMKANGVSSVEVDVRTGTVEDAQLYSFSANGKRGLSNSPEDNRSIIIRMISHPKWGKWTNAEISRHVGVSAMTVGRIKHSLENVYDEPVKTYINKHGQEATINTQNLGTKSEIKRVERPVGTKPDSSTINEDKLEIANLNDKISEMMDTINEIAEENALLKDKIAIGQWDASEIEKIDIEDVVKGLREQIRILEIDNKALKDSRDMYQNKAAELIRANKTLQSRIKKMEQ